MELVDAASYARGERKGLVAVGRSILTEPGIVVTTDPPSLPPSSHGSTAPQPPYAWSVFDEKEQRGYLNLYHLPTPADDQAMQVWVRPADATEFQRVGEVPAEFHGRSGSLQYSLSSSAGAPVELVITVEPRNAVPPRPAARPSCADRKRAPHAYPFSAPLVPNTRAGSPG